MKNNEEFEYQKISLKEFEKEYLNGMDFRKEIGLKRGDKASQDQLRHIFALGKQIGNYKKDDIKEIYHIESLSKLTVEEAIEIINIMRKDAGIDDNEVTWTIDEYGVNKIGSGYATCGHCKCFSGDRNTLGVCSNGRNENYFGKFPGNSWAPVKQKCFLSRWGEINEKVYNRRSNSYGEGF